MKLIKHVLPISLLILGCLSAFAQNAITYAIPDPSQVYVCGGGVPTNAINCNSIPVVQSGTTTVVGSAWVQDSWDPAVPAGNDWILFGGSLAQYNSGNPNNNGDLITQHGCKTWESNPPGVPPGMYCIFAYAYFSTPQYPVNEITYHFEYFYSSGGGGKGGGGAGTHRKITSGGLTFNVTHQ